MIEETATVLDLDGDSVILETDRKSTCGTCTVRSGCGTSVLAKTVGKKTVQFRLKNTLNANPGDRLIIGLDESALLKGSFLIYLLPILAMILFALLAEQMLMGADWVVAVTGMIGLMAGVWVSRKLLSQSNNNTFQPIILRKALPVDG